MNDHTHHSGPVFTLELKDAKQKWGDIIPPYTYDGGTFPGLNWPDGEAFLLSDCVSGGGTGGGTD